MSPEFFFLTRKKTRLALILFQVKFLKFPFIELKTYVLIGKVNKTINFYQACLLYFGYVRTAWKKIHTGKN